MSRQIDRIFYTDDDEDDHRFFSIALSKVRQSAKLHSFYRCDDLLDFLKKETNRLPDIIFLDQNMMGNRENECLKELKRMVRLKEIPIVVYTTGAHPKLHPTALELGASKFVIKQDLLAPMAENLAAILEEFESSGP